MSSGGGGSGMGNPRDLAITCLFLCFTRYPVGHWSAPTSARGFGRCGGAATADCRVIVVASCCSIGLFILLQI